MARGVCHCGAILGKRNKTGQCFSCFEADQRLDADCVKRSERQRKAYLEKIVQAELNRVSRDPCPRCNVRGDIGCAHKVPEWTHVPVTHT